jgi:nitrile hydratase subunit beta
MNGVHDMGGMQGMGPVDYEKNEPVFHEAWEGRVYALTRAMGAFRRWTLDSTRFAIESLPPAEYLRSSYYERWFASLVNNLVSHGFVTADEVASGHAAAGLVPATPALTEQMVPLMVNRRIPSADEPGIKPKFTVHQRVRTLNINPRGHTRLPRYARGKLGTIERDHGVYIFPDTVAHELGDKRQHVYSVRFSARELWGDTVPERDSVYLDLWDDYLERA